MIRQGYDTDTVGAICGTVLGARFGTAWIPTHRLADGSRLGRWADTAARTAPHQRTDRHSCAAKPTSPDASAISNAA